MLPRCKGVGNYPKALSTARLQTSYALLMTSEKSASVDLAELQNALDFVSSGELIDCSAYISLDTGEIIYHSSDDLGGEDTPEDLETSDRYIAVPHKRDLDLGRSLALSFTGEELPDDIEIVAGFFRRKGAYGH